MSKPANTPPVRDRFLKKKDVLEMFGISSATLFRWIKARQFPQQIRLGPNRSAWLQSEVDAHLVKLRNGRDTGRQSEAA